MARKKSKESPQPPMISNTPTLGTPTRELKIDLACGQTPREGFEGADLLAPNVKYKIDLLKFPWPWESDSVDELHCSHFIEHIPMEYINENHMLPVKVPGGEEVTGISYKHPWINRRGQDLFFAFFDECWRILKKTDNPQNPKGKMTVICPCARNNRAFQDPTHRRFIVAETFLYLSREWRQINKLDHYKVDCNFGCNVNPTVPQELTLRTPEWQNLAFSAYWNTVIDWFAVLIPQK